VDKSVPFRPQDEQDRANLQAVIDRANKGEQEAITELRTFLDENPHIWRAIGDMAFHAETSWIGLISQKNRLLVESLARETERMRQDLLGESASALEKMLVDQIITIHLEVRYREQRFASTSGLTLRQESLRIKALESAQRRLMQAMKTLEQIRTMTNRSASCPPLRLFKTADAS
jgi:hypothetical protein